MIERLMMSRTGRLRRSNGSGKTAEPSGSRRRIGLQYRSLSIKKANNSSSPLQVVRVRRRFTASLIAAALVVATLIGVYFRSEMVGFATRYADLLDIDDTGTVGGRESSGTGLESCRTLICGRPREVRNRQDGAK